MSEIKNEPAFPVKVRNVQHYGMTMRDYFAAKAMQALIGNINVYEYETISEYAYKHADAMLMEREK